MVTVEREVAEDVGSKEEAWIWRSPISACGRGFPCSPSLLPVIWGTSFSSVSLSVTHQYFRISIYQRFLECKQ